MDDRDLLLMAALIAAVRTARFEDREFQGMASPRMMAQIANSLWLARKLGQRAAELGVVGVGEAAAGSEGAAMSQKRAAAEDLGENRQESAAVLDRSDLLEISPEKAR